jgi:hypothetical protein
MTLTDKILNIVVISRNKRQNVAFSIFWWPLRAKEVRNSGKSAYPTSEILTMGQIVVGNYPIAARTEDSRSHHPEASHSHHPETHGPRTAALTTPRPTDRGQPLSPSRDPRTEDSRSHHPETHGPRTAALTRPFESNKTKFSLYISFPALAQIGNLQGQIRLALFVTSEQIQAYENFQAGYTWSGLQTSLKTDTREQVGNLAWKRGHHHVRPEFRRDCKHWNQMVL